MKKLNLFVSSVLVASTFSMFEAHLSQAMDSVVTPIVFIQPDNKKMMIKVNLDQSLSDLRVELISKGRISSDDIFQKEGCDIFQNDEKDWTIREIVTNGTLSFKPRDLLSSHLISSTVDSTLEKTKPSKEEQQVVRPEEKQAKIALWGSGIDKALKYMEDIKEAGTYGELLLILEALQQHYTAKNMIELCCSENPQIDRQSLEKMIEKDEQWQEILKTCATSQRRWQDCIERTLLDEKQKRPVMLDRKSFKKKKAKKPINGKFSIEHFDETEKPIRYIIDQQFGNYRALQNAPHPLWSKYAQISGGNLNDPLWQ